MSENIDNIKRKTISGLIWRFGERITAQLISFVVSVVLARILMPEQYGIIAIVTIFINIANVFVTNGLGTSLVQKKEADDLDFSTMFWASLILSIIVYSILFIVAPIIAKIYKNDLLTIVIRVMGIRLPLAAVNSIQQAYISRKMIYKKFFFATLFGTIVSAIVGIAMAKLNYGVWALVAQYLTNVIIDTLVLSATIDWKLHFKFSIERFKELFSFGWKIMLTGFIGTLFDQLRGLIIGARYSSEDLAFNNKGEQIPTIIANNINSSMESVLFSSISKVQDDRVAVKNATRRLIKISSFLIIPMMFGLSAIASPLVKILLTDKWLFCVPYLRVVCIKECFSILNTVNLQSIKAIGRSDISLKLEFIKKPLYLAVILITMSFGPLVICIGNAVYSVLALVINIKPNKELIKYTLGELVQDISVHLIISLIMEIIVLLIGVLQMNIYALLILQVLSGATIYIGLSWLFKVESLNYIVNILKEFVRSKIVNEG